MDNLVEIKGLTKSYARGCTAIDDLTLSLPAGRIVGLLGPNGSGKTTLIKLLAGLLSPDKGTLLIDGKKPGALTKAEVAYLPDRGFLEENKTPAQAVDFFADFFEDFSKEKAYAMLKTLDIDKNKMLKNFSKGAQEKVSLALTMSRTARLYLLDEPIAGVDPAARDFILRTIITNYNPEATLLIATHLIADVENILDDAVILQYGRLFLQESVESIRGNPHKIS